MATLDPARSRVSLSALAAMLESEHDLLSVLLVRAERLSDADDSRLRHAIQVVRDELADLELQRALIVAGLAQRLGLGATPTLARVIGAVSGADRSILASAHHEMVFLVPQVDDAGEAAGIGRLVPPSLHDFLRGG